MSGNNEALFTPELVFFDWECATPDEVFARLEASLHHMATLHPVGSMPSARARMPIPRVSLCRRQTLPFRIPIRGLWPSLYRGGEARRARDI